MRTLREKLNVWAAGKRYCHTNLPLGKRQKDASQHTFALSQETVNDDVDEHGISLRSTKPPELRLRPRPSSGPVYRGLSACLDVSCLVCLLAAPMWCTTNCDFVPAASLTFLGPGAALVDAVSASLLWSLGDVRASEVVVSCCERFLSLGTFFITFSCCFSSSDADSDGCWGVASSEDFVCLSAMHNIHVFQSVTRSIYSSNQLSSNHSITRAVKLTR